MTNIILPSLSEFVNKCVTQLQSDFLKSKKPILIIVRGLPGMGKTSCAKEMIACFDRYYKHTVNFYEGDQYFYNFDERNDYRHDLDEINTAHFSCTLRTMGDLSNKVPFVIVSNTFVHKKDIDLYMNLAREFEYQVAIVDLFYLYSEYNIGNEHAFHGNIVDHCFSANLHQVPKVVIQGMKDKYHYIGLTLSLHC